MASLRNIAVCESAVYRGLYQRQQEDPLRDAARRGAAEEESSKWAFLKKLLEIEESHDRRRRTKERQERQERTLKQASLKPVASREKMQGAEVNHKMQPATQGPEVDHSGKWLSSQILNTAAPGVDRRQAGYEDLSRHRLPPVFGHMTQHYFRPHQRQDNEHSMTENDTSASRTDPTDIQDVFAASEPRSHEGIHHGDLTRNHQYIRVSLSDLKASSASNEPDTSRHSLSSSEQILNTKHDADDHVSVSSFHRVPSRVASASKRHRQLRLPPILLPRVYTVQPRPLKAMEFPVPTKLPEPMSESEWDDLHDCRYIRHITPRKSPNQ
ncbi:hypothetical protein EGW08_015809 [Elysia chlorotica]|uniref:Uncharacterized protein n=1 Tax=Elysia chlorotica TaxID=188477 RepID=A0A3S1B6X0_ELYCH|nr:hypothetical protein EGW08_015809 [Elysia chlorotica]